jgi:hypothetical protein
VKKVKAPNLLRAAGDRAVTDFSTAKARFEINPRLQARAGKRV